LSGGAAQPRPSLQKLSYRYPAPRFAADRGQREPGRRRLWRHEGRFGRSARPGTVRVASVIAYSIDQSTGALSEINSVPPEPAFVGLPAIP
jgi:hypothetical protein